VKWLREPLLHFLFIGAAIYVLYGAVAEPAPEETDKTIVVSAGEVEWMRTSWQKRWNRPPMPEELDGLIQQYIRETVLYREALDRTGPAHTPGPPRGPQKQRHVCPQPAGK
jgi:peptidyl-prolyl cis-trans isomerase C